MGDGSEKCGLGLCPSRAPFQDRWEMVTEFFPPSTSSAMPKQNLKGSECRTPHLTNRTFGGGLGERLALLGFPEGLARQDRVPPPTRVLEESPRSGANILTTGTNNN